MNQQALEQLLGAVAAGRLSVEAAHKQLVDLPMEDIDYAHIDHHRSLRKGFPEVIFGEFKRSEQIIGIMERMALQENVILVTRIDTQKASDIEARFPEAAYDAEARMVVYQKKALPKTGQGTILVVSAGTSDIPVAREAMLTADAMGNQVQSVHDVGCGRYPSVAGPQGAHRIRTGTGRRGRYGRCVAQCGGRHDQTSGDRRSH